MATRTAKPDEPQAEENEVTRPSDLGFGPKEVEVDPVQPIQQVPQQPGDDGMVEVRMAVTIEEFTYGNPHFHTKLEEGKRYRMPAHIASYLYNLGKLSNIA